MNSWMVEDLDTGLVDGFYMNFKLANDAREYFQREFPSSRFVVREQIKERILNDCELITESSWFRSEKQT
jgi:hypothetical protein